MCEPTGYGLRMRDSESVPPRSTDAEPGEEEAAVSSIPLDADDGSTVVITQQTAGPGNQVGGGEFKRGTLHKSVDTAAEEQERLEHDAPKEDA